jgi:hypothetical protein
MNQMDVFLKQQKFQATNRESLDFVTHSKNDILKMALF